MTAARRFLILTAAMGSGHDAVASALAQRLEAAGHETVRADVLRLLPAGIGTGIRAGYRVVIERAPVLYAGVYQAFFRGGGSTPRPGSAPLAMLAERPLLDLVQREQADVVVSVFHLGAQVTGRLRARKELPAPAAVVMTEFEPHRQWLHPGNDLYLCHADEIAAGIRRGTGCDAAAYGPVVDATFTVDGPAASPVQDSRPIVLLSTGAWGIASSLVPTIGLLDRAGYAPVVLCGRSDRLRRHLAEQTSATALGWVEDMPALLRAASVLVDNAAGQTAMEALATGLPVIGYRPIPGHGADGVRLMSRLGLSDYARDENELRAALARLACPGPSRDRRVAAGRAIFVHGVVDALANLS